MDLNRKKIMVIFGTRPEATKMSIVVQALKKQPQWFETVTIVTGQQKEQLFQALQAFDLKPDINLDIMKEQQTLIYILSAALSGLNEIIKQENPDLILVHGDTQTSVSAALAACYNKIPFAHVEAGLRTFNKLNPWPEEINRMLIDSVTDIYFAPTQTNKQNLLNSGVKPDQIFVTGQTQIDAAISMYKPDYYFTEDNLNSLDYSKKIIIATVHRRENYGKPMEQIFRAMRRIADEFSNVLIVYPVHLSPTIQETAKRILNNHKRIILMSPLKYQDMINLIAKSYLVMSDSGGLQEECPIFKKPLILMRETTERPEGVAAGVTTLCGTGEDAIYDCTVKLLTDSSFYNRMTLAENPFGDGRASQRIVNALGYYFGFIHTYPDEFCGSL